MSANPALIPRRSPSTRFSPRPPSSICGADDDIVRPAHVRLLDYEIELGLVVGRDITSPVDVRPGRLAQFLAGVTIVNDVSARDVQLPQIQFYKGKSYRSFCPVGPCCSCSTHRMAALERASHAALRQWRTPPGRPLRRNDLRAASDLDRAQRAPGSRRRRPDRDGHPGGLRRRRAGQGRDVHHAPLHVGRDEVAAVPEEGGRQPQRYLKPGDEIVASIRTDDGALDLGEQRNRVVAP